MHENYGSVEIIEKDKRLLVELPLSDGVSHFGTFFKFLSTLLSPFVNKKLHNIYFRL